VKNRCNQTRTYWICAKKVIFKTNFFSDQLTNFSVPFQGSQPCNARLTTEVKSDNKVYIVAMTNTHDHPMPPKKKSKKQDLKIKQEPGLEEMEAYFWLCWV
jgi:hypothetical protein